MSKFRSISEFQKPLRFNLNEWKSENCYHLQKAEEHCKLAERVRSQSEQLRQNVVDVLEKNKNETNTRFRERISDEEYRQDEIERVRTSIQLNIEPLAAIKCRIEAAIKSVESCALQINQRCLHLREGRIGIDLVNDEVEKQLLQELKIITGALEIMRKSLEQVEETQRQLRASLYALNQDLRNKLAVIQIDKEALSLKETHVGLSIYQGKEPLDPATITIEEWEKYTDETLNTARGKLNNSRELRVHIDSLLKQVEKDLRAQDSAVNEAFRVRIEQVKQNKNKLEMRHFEIVRQANEMARNIAELEKAISDKEGYIALAHTRLGKRAQRPGAELVCDAVNNNLRREVLDIRAVVAQLRQNLAQAEAVQRLLLKTQIQLEEDINIKINSLKIDEVDCMTLRQSIQHPVF